MITLGQLSDFTDDERSQLQAALDLVNGAIPAPGFLQLLAGATFDNTEDCNAVVMAKLVKDATITRLYCEDLGWWATHVSKTIAFEEPDGTVTFNRAYFDQQTPASLANTLFHEFMHCLGYSHTSSTDYASWPYQGGNLMEQYLESLLHGSILIS